MKATLAIIEGDGIGTEVVPQGVKALKAIARRYKHDLSLVHAPLGYASWKKTGDAAPRETIELCRSSDGVLMGALGAAQWAYSGDIPPGWGRNQFYREMNYMCNVRPVKVSPHVASVSPVKAERVRGTDLIIVRNRAAEWPKFTDKSARGRFARDILEFHEDEIVPRLKFAYLLAQSRRKKLCLMCQSSMFETSKLWLQIFEEMAQQYPDVAVDVQAPDNCAMLLMREPTVFDVIVGDSAPMGGMMNNLAALLMGSVGMGPGTTIALRDGDTCMAMLEKNGLYEPIHGSAPRRAGLGIANPIGTVLAAAMLLRYSLGLEREAQAIEAAVEEVLAQGYRTYDIMEPGKTKVGTAEMGDRIAAALEADCASETA